MLTRTLLSSPLLVTTLGLAPLLAGCLDTTIVGGGEGGGGGGGAGEEAVAVVGTASTSAGGTGGAASATAWLEAALDEPTRSSVCQGDPCGGDDMLFLFVDALGSSCADPLTSEISTAPDAVTPTTWTVAIGIPPAHHEVGVHAIDETFVVTSGAWTNGSDTSGMVASGGIGWGGMGTVEILELTDTTIRFVTSGLGQPSDGIEYAAPRCGVVDLPPEGIAIAGDALGGGGGGDTATADDGLTLVIGDELASCTDALATTCTGETWQVQVSLPADYVTPGLYALTDPRITVTNCTAQPKFLGGTIEVVDVDETRVIVRFADVVDHQLELQQDVRIERCP